MKDVIASYEALINLFERVQFSLQRLHRYTTIPLTPDMTLLLGKIMAQVLSVLALSTKEMKDMRISESTHSIFSSMADYETERLVKRIAGRTDVEDALQRLDLLTKEESLMTAARNLEVTHRVDVNVMATQEATHRVEEVIHDVDGNVKETKELTRDVHDNVITIDDNVKVTRHGVPNSFQVFIRFTNLCLSVVEKAIDEQQRSLHLVVLSSLHIAEAYSQGVSYGRSFENGSPLRIPPSIITPRATSSMRERQCGSSRVTNSTSGRRTVRCCGSAAIVCFFFLVSLSLPLRSFPGFQRALERVFFGMYRPNDSNHIKLRVS